MSPNKLKYDPTNKHAHIRYLLFSRCQIELDQGNYDDARVLAYDFFSLYPQDIQTKRNLIELLISSATLLIESKSYDEPLLLLKQVLSDSPLNSTALREMAYLYIVKGNTIEDLKKVSDLNVFFLNIQDTLIICITYCDMRAHKSYSMFTKIIGSGRLTGQTLILTDIKKYIREEIPVKADFVILNHKGNEYLLYVYPIEKLNIVTLKRAHESQLTVTTFKGEPLEKRRKKGIEEDFDLNFRLVQVA